MPPRRRNKSSQHRKRPLVFTESPVNIQHHVTSPVLCVEHPLTAKSVPVDECSNMSWVSPQFSQMPQSCRGKRRLARRNRSPNKTTLDSRQLEKENSHLHHTRKNTKFKALKFLGEASVQMSTVDDVSIESNDSDSDTAAVPPGGNNRKRRSVAALRTRSNSRTFDRKKRATKNRPSWVDGSFDSVNLPRPDCSVNTPLSDKHSPTVDPTSEKTDNGNTICTLHSTPGESNKDGGFTKLRTVETPNSHKAACPSKRLFLSSSTRTGSRSTEADLQRLGDVRQNLNCSNQNLSQHLKKNSPKSDDSWNFRRSKRIHHKLLQSLQATGTPDRAGEGHTILPFVLVADTPESEYDVPVKIRKWKDRAKCSTRRTILE